MQAETLGPPARGTFTTLALKSDLEERCTTKESSLKATSVHRRQTAVASTALAWTTEGAYGNVGAPSLGYNWLVGMISLTVEGLDQRRNVVAAPKFSKKSRRMRYFWPATRLTGWLAHSVVPWRIHLSISRVNW